MNALKNKVLVLGIGNVLLKDDGLGPLVVRELQKTYRNPDVTFLDGGTLGLDLLAYVGDYNCLLIVDALDLGEKPGSIFCWEGKTLKGLTQQVSFHQVGVKELLDAIDLLDLDLEIVIMGVQLEDISWGLELSKTVQNAIPLLKETVCKRLSQFVDVDTIVANSE